MKLNDAKLILENGTTMEGLFYKHSGKVFGNFVFNTSLVGYEEALTDPSYNQEILVMTFPIQGIYGVCLDNIESKKIQIAGFVVQEIEENFSNHHSTKSIGDFLEENKVVVIQNIDTRALTKIIRDKGSMKGCICPLSENNDTILNEIKSYSPEDHTKIVSNRKILTQKISTPKLNILCFDFGMKKTIITQFSQRNIKLDIVNQNYHLSKTDLNKYDAIFLSNGPGDPEELVDFIGSLKKNIGKIPIIAICLGHQLVGLAMGMKTQKLKYGHRSINHPVINTLTNNILITSQNHNYILEDIKIPKDVEISYKSINDKTIEGLYSKKKKIFTTQFHPEASPGPQDALFIFDEFIQFVESFSNDK